MPIIMLPNTGIESTVSRPVTLDIAQQVMEILQIPPETKIVFKGDSDSIYQSGSLVADHAEHVALSGNSQLTIEVTERFLEEFLGTIAVNQPEHTPYFYDDKLGIVAKLVYIPTEVTVNFKYKAQSKSLAAKIRHDTWARVSNLRDLNVHTVTYNVPISTTYIDVIRYLHALRENVSGYGESFQEYFLSYASPAVTQISRLEGSNPNYSLQETATRILGMFDFTGAMERAERDSEGSSYTMEFSYKFTYEKPSNQVLKFPVAVHNQLVDPRLFRKDSPNLGKKTPRFYSSSIKHMRQFEVDHVLEQLAGNDQVVTVPSYDDITYENKVNATRTLFSAICSVEPEKPRHYLNLNELGSFLLDDMLLEYIREVDWRYISIPYQSFINVSCYRNSYLAGHKNVVVDNALNVNFNTDLNPRVINRVRISIVDNILDLDPEAIIRLLRYPKLLIKLVLATSTNRVHLERLRPRVDITHLFKDMPNIGSPRSLYDTNRVQVNTVLSTGVRAFRSKEDLLRGTNTRLTNSIYGTHRG